MSVVRWALEETGRSYAVDTVPANAKSAAHRSMQPFAQVPIICDGDLTLFESGAIVLHLAEGTPLLPEDRLAEITQWLMAALNTVETACGHWMQLVLARRMPDWFGPSPSQDLADHAREGMEGRLDEVERGSTIFSQRPTATWSRG